MTHTILHGDCLSVMPTLDANRQEDSTSSASSKMPHQLKLLASGALRRQQENTMAKAERTVHAEIQGTHRTYRVESDRHCFSLTYRHVTKTGEETWRQLPASYYGRFDNVCLRLLREGLRDNDASDIHGLQKAIGEWGRKIVEMCRNVTVARGGGT